ncbi:MAG: FAD-dependent oxidoreductase [Pseudomonadales bacterium]
MKTNYDVAVVGGGMVGAALAAALADSSLQIAVIEPAPPAAFDSAQVHDLRVSALNRAAQNFLCNIGAWEGVQQKRSCPFKRLKTWELSEANAATEFNADDLALDHLGHIVENRILQLSLLERLAQLDNVTLIYQRCARFDLAAGANMIELDSGEQLISKLVVGADGAHSAVRQASGIGIHAWDYQQSALVINVRMGQGQQDITWQQFTPSGPLAFLPLSGDSASLVWYNSAQAIEQLLALDNQALRGAVLEAFPSCLGPVEEIYARAAFPLTRQHAQAYCAPGVVLIGDAAHTIHPLAGQGVNIGLLDAAQLAQTLLDAHHQGEEISSLAVLSRYQRARRNHNFAVMQLMDSFYRVFNNDIAPLKALRNLGLAVAGRFTPARRKAMALAMGVEGPLPVLAREH